MACRLASVGSQRRHAHSAACRQFGRWGALQNFGQGRYLTAVAEQLFKALGRDRFAGEIALEIVATGTAEVGQLFGSLHAFGCDFQT